MHTNFNSKQAIENLFPDFLKDKPGYSVFVQLASSELSKCNDFIDALNMITNIDRTPEEYLSHLGSLIGFKYLPYFDDEVQRDCLKLFRQEDKKYGTLDELAFLATYGDIDGHVTGELFIPGTFVERPKATVILPREHLFKWSHSTWSGPDKLAGPIAYKEGTILIEVTRLNDIIREKVQNKCPSGMLIVYKLVQNGKVEYITHRREFSK